MSLVDVAQKRSLGPKQIGTIMDPSEMQTFVGLDFSFFGRDCRNKFILVIFKCS